MRFILQGEGLRLSGRTSSDKVLGNGEGGAQRGYLEFAWAVVHTYVQFMFPSGGWSRASIVEDTMSLIFPYFMLVLALQRARRYI